MKKLVWTYVDIAARAEAAATVDQVVITEAARVSTGALNPHVASEMAEHAGDDLLTPRELDVLEQVASGKSNKRIADWLDISEDTVKAHVRSILSKLGANDRTHAVTIALRRGFLDM